MDEMKRELDFAETFIAYEKAHREAEFVSKIAIPLVIIITIVCIVGVALG